MTDRRNTKRRKCNRFKITGGAVVLLHKQSVIGLGGPRLIELGPITDISLGGLSVQYVEDKIRDVDASELSISVPSEGIAVSGLSFRVISDRAIAQLPDGKLIRNRCVEFADPSSHKRFLLECFIERYSMLLKKDRRSGVDRRQYKDLAFDEEGSNRMYDRRSKNDRRKP